MCASLRNEVKASRIEMALLPSLLLNRLADPFRLASINFGFLQIRLRFQAPAQRKGLGHANLAQTKPSLPDPKGLIDRNIELMDVGGRGDSYRYRA